MNLSYKQSTKNSVRHTVIRNAVELLTINRYNSCCVRNSYVRDLYEYFIQQDESHEKTEALKIDQMYIKEWERIHANLIGTKRPDELSVCYLSGPEPENDFDEFVSMGILPQNIWAFESERHTYLQALDSFDRSSFLQPKIIKTSIERFFENSPKKFDIVYLDACASLISDQHALRCVSSLFQNQRLNSPGVLITNFAFFDCSNITEKEQYIDLISRYNLIRDNRDTVLVNDKGSVRFKNGYNEYKNTIEQNLETSYGDFITAMICNAASIAIPSLRFCNSTYLKTLTLFDPVPENTFDYTDVNTIRDNTLFKFFASNAFLRQAGAEFTGIKKADKLILELSGVNPHFNLLSSLQKLHIIRNNQDTVPTEIESVIDFFDNNPLLYQFLDKPNRVLFFDSVINQFSFPMHYVSEKINRLSYIAKEKRMFTDLILFDECRYIYDWLPAIHQITDSFSNPSWQYTFRFGLDGLIKQRINYNNEFFFRGSVVSKTIPEFSAKTIPERIRVN